MFIRFSHHHRFQICNDFLVFFDKKEKSVALNFRVPYGKIRKIDSVVMSDFKHTFSFYKINLMCLNDFMTQILKKGSNQNISKFQFSMV